MLHLIYKSKKNSVIHIVREKNKKIITIIIVCCNVSWVINVWRIQTLQEGKIVNPGWALQACGRWPYVHTALVDAKWLLRAVARAGWRSRGYSGGHPGSFPPLTGGWPSLGHPCHHPAWPRYLPLPLKKDALYHLLLYSSFVSVINGLKKYTSL